MQINDYIKAKGKDIKDLYIKGMKDMKYFDKIKSLGLCLKNMELEFKEQKPLNYLELKDALNFENDYSPNEYSKYFYDYFEYEDKDKKDEKIIFQKNKIRDNIFNNITITLRDNPELKSFKFTGPSSIGKSFTLFRLCHICYNIAYINLKILNKYKTNLYYSYSIIISELQRFDINKYLENFNLLINENYKSNKSYLELLLNIMSFLNNLAELNLSFVFIFDQFKIKYITNGFLEKIKTFDKIKIVQCSSINDKNMREECYKTWFLIGKNIFELTKDNQDYYFYYSQIYNYKSNKNSENKIFKKLGYLPKYTKKYKNYKNENIMLDEVKGFLDKKIEEFCSLYELEKSLLFSNLKHIINKEYNYDKFESIIKYCPLKYFIIIFKKYIFKIKPIFPFMKIIINYKLKETECDDYFIKEKYKNDIITNNYVKGDFFEASAKFGLVKLKFPKKENYISIMVNEIVSMDKIIDENARYYIEESEEDNSEKEEEEEEKDIQDKLINIASIKKILQRKELNNINENVKEEMNKNEHESINIEEENNNNDEKGKEEFEIEEGEDDEEEEINVNENYNLENIKEIKEEKDMDDKREVANKELDKLLKAFKVKTDKKSLKEEGLSDNAILLLKDIEDYRIDEINEQLCKEEVIDKSNFNGNESIFLDQLSKWGKALDSAYLYGNKNDKVFLGFKMKCNFLKQKSLILMNLKNNNAFNKNYIKKSCRKILVNSMKLFNCKITKWYYYLIFYYNPKNINENINKKYLDKCDENNICYFFYEPKEKIFFIKGKKRYIKIKGVKINAKANLDIDFIDVNKFAFEIPAKSKLEIGKNFKEMKESFRKDLIKTFKMEENSSISDVLDKIKLSINALDYSLYFQAKCVFNKGLICPKYENYVLLYKKKNEEKDKIDFIAALLENQVVKYIELSSKTILNHIYDVIDEDSKYYYCLFKAKEIKIRKRKKNEVNFFK